MDCPLPIVVSRITRQTIAVKDSLIAAGRFVVLSDCITQFNKNPVLRHVQGLLFWIRFVWPIAATCSWVELLEHRQQKQRLQTAMESLFLLVSLFAARKDSTLMVFKAVSIVQARFTNWQWVRLVVFLQNISTRLNKSAKLALGKLTKQEHCVVFKISIFRSHYLVLVVVTVNVTLPMSIKLHIAVKAFL